MSKGYRESLQSFYIYIYIFFVNREEWTGLKDVENLPKQNFWKRILANIYLQITLLGTPNI